MVRPGGGRKPKTVWPGTVLDAELIVVRNRLFNSTTRLRS